MSSRSSVGLLRSERAAVAPTVALSLFALIGTGGIAFDYARLAGMNSELQTAADQAALAAATQLDQKPGAITRAKNAAQTLVANQTLFANDGGNTSVTVPTITFYVSYDSSAESFGATTTSDTDARFVQVQVGSRKAYYALTPVVAAFKSGDITALALAGVGQSICRVPPVMLCNPNEPNNNSDENYPANLVEGQGLKLVTGNASAPGNFGWLQSNVGNGANALAEALGYNVPPGDCLPESGVTTKTGMDTSVLNAFNTRFDVYANGNTTCPSQGGGTCSPSQNTRKDLVCGSTDGISCKNNSNWTFDSTNSYQGYVNPSNQVSTLPIDKSKDPVVMGYPMDLCHSVPSKASCGIAGDGNWDRDAYFRVNYGGTTNWTGLTGLSSNTTRYKVYNWELAHPPASIKDGNNYAISHPATGISGITPGGSNPDRRRISIAVLNCIALTLHGKTSGIPVPKWLDVFLIQPAFQRSVSSGTYTDQKEIYVEVIGDTTEGNNGATNSQVVQRSVPYLIR